MDLWNWIYFEITDGSFNFLFVRIDCLKIGYLTLCQRNLYYKFDNLFSFGYCMLLIMSRYPYFVAVRLWDESGIIYIKQHTKQLKRTIFRVNLIRLRYHPYKNDRIRSVFCTDTPDVGTINSHPRCSL